MMIRSHDSHRRPKLAAAFTLVELLVVLFLVLLLAAIALPNVREVLSDQLIARTARGVSTYIDVARNRAIAEGRQVGILLERGALPGDPRDRAHSIRIRQLADVPPYSGDASNAVAVIQTNGTEAHFNPSDNQLLALSASMVANGPGDVDDPQAPIRNGDYIEFPGGRAVPFTIGYRPLTALDTVPVIIYFDLNEARTNAYGVSSNLFPSGARTVPTARPIKYRIHRQPIVSTVAPLDLPRGVAIDLNYSGLGVSGNQFAPDMDTTIGVPNIAILFGPDGKVVRVTEVDFSTTPPTARVVPPTGQIFLCLGDADGIRPDNLFALDRKATATFLNLDSAWIVINPSTGRVSASPMAPVATFPAGVITDPTDVSLDTAIAEARFFANLSDTVDQE